MKNTAYRFLRSTSCIIAVFTSLFISHQTLFAQTTSDRPWVFWKPADVKGLDPWGDSNGDAHDIVAVYEKESADSIYFRVDIFDIQKDSALNLFLALDFSSGGNTQLIQGNSNLISDISWDLLLRVTSKGTRSAYDASFANHPEYVSSVIFDDSLDYVQFAVPKQVMTNWNGQPFKIQAFVLNDASNTIIDRTSSYSTDAVTGRAKLLIVFENTGFSLDMGRPSDIGGYDGYGYNVDATRVGERHGLRYLLDASEKYNVPLTLSDLRIDALPGAEFLGVNDRIRDLERRNLLGLTGKATYGFFMPWQPKYVDSLMLALAREYREIFGFRTPKVFYPYEGYVSMKDIDAIKSAGYDAIWSPPDYQYSVGFEDSYTSPLHIHLTEQANKINVFNGMKFFFSNPVGFRYDARWGVPFNNQIIPDGHKVYVGTDRGPSFFLRRIMLDLAEDVDQEKYYTIGDDINLTPMVFSDVTDRFMCWIGSHPWIEGTTMESILGRNWTPIDHGTVSLNPDDPLQRFKPNTDYGYNANFWLDYYGGSANGNYYYMPNGTQIESYFDYVPYLRNGQLIPSGKKMGDYKTPGTIVFETLQNLKSAPQNALTRLAWLSYFMGVSEQSLHTIANYQSGATTDDRELGGGAYLAPQEKVKANHLGQINKIVAAAQWADEVGHGKRSSATEVVKEDLDLDGENEYVLKNDKVFATFAIDGGRMDYAFIYNPSTGPMQMAAPRWQNSMGSGNAFADGKTPDPGTFETPFEDNATGYRDKVYSVTSDSSSITFTSPDGKISKTFTLAGNTVSAKYQLTSPDWTLVGLNLKVDMPSMLTPNFWRRISKVQLGKTVGWKNAYGGSGTVDLTGIGLDQIDSFIDSPSRTDQFERPPGYPYPAGQYFQIPDSRVIVNNQSATQFTVNLTLSPDLSKSALLQMDLSSVSFSSVPLSQPREMIMNITNVGNDTLKISNVVSQKLTFSVSPTTLNVLPKQSARFTIRFKTTALGADTSIIQIFSNSTTSPDKILATGWGSNSSIVNISVGPSNHGTVTGGGIFDTGSNVTIIATPDSGYKFNNWTENGTVVSTSSVLTFTINNDRTLVADFSLIKPPDQRYALKFDGNQVAIAPVASQLNLGAHFTLETWIYVPSSTLGVIVGKAIPSGDPWSMYDLEFMGNGKQLQFRQSTGQPGSNTGTWPPTDYQYQQTWTHVAATLDSLIMRLYINGSLVSNQFSNGVPGNNTMPFSLGAGLSSPTQNGGGITGALRQARIWNRTLSQSEIQTRSTQYLTGAEPGLVGYWPMDDSTGQTARDLGPYRLPLMLGTSPGPDNNDPSWVRTNTLVAVEPHQKEIPLAFSLEQNYPNPFNPSTTIRFQLPKAVSVSLKVFNVLGQEISSLVDGKMDLGSHKVQWNANVPSGIYFYRLHAEEFVETKKMILLR